MINLIYILVLKYPESDHLQPWQQQRTASEPDSQTPSLEICCAGYKVR